MAKKQRQLSDVEEALALKEEHEFPTPRHNNQHLFADYYLNEIIRRRQQWFDLYPDAEETMNAVKAIMAGFTPSENERQTEEGLVIPILRLLGHTFEVQPSLTTPEGSKSPDYVFYDSAESLEANKGKALTSSLPLEGGLAIGDAKYWNRPLDVAIRQDGRDALSNKNPSYQIWHYMVHSGVTWGILTNGKLWRLYHKDTAQKLDHFYEVDLEELVDLGKPGWFVYFYAFFRREAFDDGPLSLASILRESIDYAQGVGEALREQVYVALRHIAQGFLSHTPNALEPDEDTLKTIYDNSLVLLYRLLFILYAEARELLPVRANRTYRKSYSLRALTHEIADDLNRQRELLPDSAMLWPRVKMLFDVINAGEERLGVAIYNGGLFDPKDCPFLVNNAVGDAHLQKAIDKLARVNGAFVDYRDLSVRHMGTIYEGLLEHHLRPLPVPDDGWLITLASDKGERKTSGSYFTADDIVKYIVEHAVGPVIEDAVAGVETEAEKAEAVLAVSVLDPAMGSGHFLVEATEFIARFMVDQAIPADGKTTVEADLAFWKRRVAQSCVYGVDLNPLAVELAKLSLWLTTVAKDRPLSFLDHHLRTGNSLVGARLEHLEVRTIDPKRKGVKKPQYEQAQISLFDGGDFAERISAAVESMHMIEESEAETVAQVKEQERLFVELQAGLRGKHRRLLNVVAASPFGLRVDSLAWLALVKYVLKGNGAVLPVLEKLLDQADTLAEREGFFHWEMEFPEIYFDRHGSPLGEKRGFDVVVGNPPWERIKLQENEFFAKRDKAIAQAPKAADRRKLIATLKKSQPELWREYEAAKASADGLLSYVRDCGFYPLMGRGDTNLYSLFAERALQLMAVKGRAGLVTPSGIATDDTTKLYFQHIVSHRMLAELLDFENREGMFAEVHREQKFSVTLLQGTATPQKTVRCGFFLHSMRDARNPDRVCFLSVDDFRLFNPNTLTCPVFRRQRDADLTRKIYRHLPVLVDKTRGREGDPWGAYFFTMLHMANDSHLFRTAADLAKDGYWLGEGNVYTKAQSQYVPLYEAKMIHQYDHRYASGVSSDVSARSQQASALVADESKRDAHLCPTPRYWVPAAERSALGGKNRGKPYMLGFRNIVNPNNVRTFICTIMPFAASGHSLEFISTELNDARELASLAANFNSFALDYVARQKIGSRNATFFTVEQFPIVPPLTYAGDWHGVSVREFVGERVLELCYTAHDLKGFAEDMGYDGPPFAWDEERRLHLKCQLDALYFHLYGLTREETAEILDTFPIVKRQDEAQYGTFRTRDLIIAYHNAYAAGDMSAWVKG